jgi:hypothetical protein
LQVSFWAHHMDMPVCQISQSISDPSIPFQRPL